MIRSSLVAIPLLAAALSMPACAQAKTSFPDRVCDVTQYRALGTKLWFDTEAFQKAIDDCASKGGGTVRVPRGWYLVGPLFLKSNINFKVEKYAEVLAATDPALYGATEHPVTPEGNPAKLAFINITDAENVAITGEGLIDGQGAVWWERMRAFWRSDQQFATSGAAHQRQRDSRPRLVLARNSRNLLFQGVRFENSPTFHIVLRDSENITIDHVTIMAPAHAPNTDAIDPINSSNVLITNNTISCGDDVVAIKGEGADPTKPQPVSANIVIRGNTILQGRGISIGSGTQGGVKNVLAENNSFDGSMYGFRIKTRRGHGGEVSNIVFRNNKMTNVHTAFVLSSYYEYRPFDPKEAERQLQHGGFIIGHQMWPGEDDKAQPFVTNKTPDIHDVTIENVLATGSDSAGVVTGLPERGIKNVLFRNVRVEAEKGLLIRNAGVTAENVELVVKSGNPVTMQKRGRYKAH